MKLYRLASHQYIDDLSGTGGLFSSGRWHYKGTRIVYFSESVALAKLEILANTNILPKSLGLITVDVPDKLPVNNLDFEYLPNNWHQFPPPYRLKDLALEWINNHETVLLRVPSVHSPYEFNYLMNPNHHELNQITVIKKENHIFDTRLK